MKALTRWAVLSALTLLLAAWAPASHAAVSADTGEIELHVGWYFPDEADDESLDDLIYGIRGGYNFTEHFGMQGDISHFDTEADNVPVFGDVDFNTWLFDLSFEWQVNPDDMAVFQLYGGPGYVLQDIDTQFGKVDDEDFFTAHLGAGVQIGFGNRFYVRPDARARWIDSDSNNSFRSEGFDWQASVGFGWYLGANAGTTE